MGAGVFSAFGVSFIGILQKLTWNGKLYWIREGTYGDNVFGPFVNRNSYAAFAGTMVPVAVCMGLAALWRRQQGREDSLPRLALWVFAAITTGGGVFFSLSRGGILATSLSMGIVFVFLIYYGRRRTEMAVIDLSC